MSAASTAIICFMIAAVAFISGVINAGDWYGFSCLMIGVVFSVTGALLIRQP